MNTYNFKTLAAVKVAIAFVLLVLFLSPACKKDSQNSSPLLLSKVLEDALLREEYIYSAERKLIRRNGYSIGTGQSVPNTIWLYDYLPGGQLNEVTMFNASNNQFSNKYRLQYDANGRPSRMDDLANDNSIEFYHMYEYDATGKLFKYSVHNAGSNKKTAEGHFSYDAEGRIAMMKRFTFSGVNPVLYDSVNYSFEKDIPAHWNYFETLPFIALPNGSRTFYEMTCTDMLYYFSDAPPARTDYDFLDKTYNTQGYLVSQRITLERDFPANVSSREMIYEYIE